MRFTQFLTAKNALALFDQVHPTLVILDLMLPDLNGEEVCRWPAQKSRECRLSCLPQKSKKRTFLPDWI